MKHILAMAIWAALAGEARAMVGDAAPASDAASRAVATLVGQRGNVCTATLIAPKIALTAAHCVAQVGRYRVMLESQTANVTRVAVHPQFSAREFAAHRATADVALVHLDRAIAAGPVATLGVPASFAPGRSYRVMGVGVTRDGSALGLGVVRGATLAATGQPGTRQLRLVDATTNNSRAGLGACTGDSGAPVFETQDGRDVVIGIVGWSTAAGNAAGCGGLTGVVPLTLYRDWIAAQMK